MASLKRRFRLAVALILEAVWCVLLLPSPASALDPDKAIGQLVHRAWYTEDGLPQSTITAIAQTVDGYLWIATQDGLARFDGMRFEILDATTVPEMAGSYVTALLADASGDLWLGTRHGRLARLSSGRWATYPTTPEVNGNAIRALLRDPAGTLWVAGDGGVMGLARRDLKTVASTALPQVMARCMVTDEKGVVWVGTEGHGLVRLSDGVPCTLASPQGPVANAVLSLCARRAGGLWIGTAEAGLFLRDGGRLARYTTRDGLASDTVLALLEDDWGTLWIGTRNGLARLIGDSLQSYDTSDGLSATTVLSLLEDREGALWVGTLRGLNQFVNPEVVVYTMADGLPDDLVWTVLEDGAGHLWVGTHGGLARRVDRRFETVPVPVSGGLVSAIHVDRDGVLWLGTKGRGLFRCDKGGCDAMSSADGLDGKWVRCFLERGSGDLWAGTDQGLSILRGGRIVAGVIDETLAGIAVTALAESPRGDVWVGTVSCGIYRLSEGCWTNHRMNTGIGSPFVTSILADEDGAVWIATEGAGLRVLRNGELFGFSRREGLFNGTYCQVLEDSQGRLWTSTTRGLLCVEKQQLKEIAAGKRRLATAIAFGISDGMRSVECTAGRSPASWRGSDQLLYFSTVNGLVEVDPTRIEDGPPPPPVYIETVLVDGVEADLAGAHRLAPGTRHVVIQFSAPSLKAPEKIRFRCRLEDLDDNWIELGQRREATYTNLAPGEYSFHVSACNSAGVWNEESARWTFVVRPFFHQTPAFRALLGLGLALVVLAAHRLRTIRLRARNAVLAERDRIAGGIHDTVSQCLVGLALQLEAAERNSAVNPQMAWCNVARASELVQESREEMRRAVDDLPPRLLEGCDLSDALRSLGEKTVAGSGMELVFEVHGHPRRLPAGAEHELWHIVQESVTNAVRHSRGQTLRIIMEYAPRLLRLVVADDGVGLCGQGEEEPGFGSSGMHRRVERRRWRLWVQSAPGGGTSVYVEIPLRWWWPAWGR